MHEFDLYVSFDEEKKKLYITHENGSGAEYKVTNPKQAAFAFQEYLSHYCVKETENEN